MHRAGSPAPIVDLLGDAARTGRGCSAGVSGSSTGPPVVTLRVGGQARLGSGSSSAQRNSSSSPGSQGQFRGRWSVSRSAERAIRPGVWISCARAVALEVLITQRAPITGSRPSSTWGRSPTSRSAVPQSPFLHRDGDMNWRGTASIYPEGRDPGGRVRADGPGPGGDLLRAPAARVQFGREPGGHTAAAAREERRAEGQVFRPTPPR
jgi:hypothetical protein